jgi:capsular polysaccharide biosynthesis protein
MGYHGNLIAKDHVIYRAALAYLSQGELVPPPEGVAGLTQQMHDAPRKTHFVVAQRSDVTLLHDSHYAPTASVFTDSIPDIPTSPPVVVDEPVISITSAEPSNWGSWIYRTLPKLIDAPDDERPILVYQHTVWQKALFKLFFPNRRAIEHWPTRPYVLRDVMIPSMRNPAAYFDAGVIGFYRRFAERLGQQSPVNRLYMARRNARLRPLANEAELINVLEGFGFTAVDIETLPIEDQIRLVRDAEYIACPGGSGLYNLVFASNAKFVLDIEAGKDWLFAHHNIMRSCGLKHSILYGERLEASNPHGRWQCNPHDVAQILKMVTG